MKVGLIDVDGKHFPNLALMKISAYHKQLGDKVSFYDYFEHYDVVYKSKVFSNTPDYEFVINADKVIQGGTGYAIHGAGGEHYCKEDDKDLAREIEHIYPDYNLYNLKDTAIGFLTRGCPRGCQFCIVGEKEGLKSRKVADLSEFWNGQKNIILCDPNILACYSWKELFEQLEKSKAYIDFNQGLDARLLTEEKCEYLNKLKLKEIHFAWDRYEDKNVILPKLEMFSKFGKFKRNCHNAIVYVLINHGTTIEEDLERIYMLRELGYWAYIMIYDKPNAPHIKKEIARWVNNRYIFSKCEKFEDYKKIKSNKKEELLLL